MLAEGRIVSRGSQPERLSKLETENSFLFTQQGEMDKKLDTLIDAVGKLGTKLDTVDNTIKAMAPHVTTVANAKTFWAWTGKITAYTTAIGAAGYSGWTVVKPWLIWVATGK